MLGLGLLTQFATAGQDAPSLQSPPPCSQCHDMMPGARGYHGLGGRARDSGDLGVVDHARSRSERRKLLWLVTRAGMVSEVDVCGVKRDGLTRWSVD